MIQINKDKLDFNYLLGIIQEYHTLHLNIFKESDDVDVREDYFYAFGDILHQVSEIAAIQYTEKILSLDNSIEYCKNEILNASKKNDIVLLRIFLLSPLHTSSFLSLSKEDIFLILSSLLTPYHHKKEEGEQFPLGYVFEQFVEWFGDEELSAVLLEEIFSIDKVSGDWYYSMMPSINKLLWNLHPNKRKLEILKKGLSCPSRDIVWTFKENIRRNYTEQGLVDVNLNWIENNE